MTHNKTSLHSEESGNAIWNGHYHNPLLVAESAYKASHTLLVCEHPHVYTLGKSAEQKNLLLSETTYLLCSLMGQTPSSPSLLANLSRAQSDDAVENERRVRTRQSDQVSFPE